MTKEDLQAFGTLMDHKLEPINKRLDSMDKRLDSMDKRLDGMDKRLDKVEESLQVVRESQITFELVHIPKIGAALDGYKLNSEKLDDIKNNLEEITPTVQALEILHQTGYAK